MKKFLYSFATVLSVFIHSEFSAQTNDCTTISEFPFTETFEDDSNSRICWTQKLESGTEGQDSWSYEKGALNGGITQAHNGELNARCRRYPYSDESIVKLISPKMDVTSLETPTLSFYHAQEAWGLDQSEMKVYYRLSENAEWKLLKYYWTNVANWTKEIIALPEKSSELQIAFEGINKFGRSVVVDDVMIGNDGGEAGTCMPSTPSNHFENGNGDLNQLYIANDFSINALTNLNISQIVLNVIEKEGVSSFDIYFYDSGDFGTPNNELASFKGLTASSTNDLFTSESGFTFQENVIDLPETYTIKGGPTGKKIWMVVKAVGNNPENNLFWETTSILNSENASMASDNGTSWQYIDGNMDGVFTLVGTCEPGDPTEEYCTPGYWYVMPITSVAISDLTQTSSASSATGYENFSDYRANVKQGETYNLEIESLTYPQSTQNFTIFIDWNQNGKLNDEGEVYQAGSIYSDTGTDGPKLTFPIQIPASSNLGEVRMRIVSEVQEYVTNPCSVFLQGQTEDYTLSVEESLATHETSAEKTVVYPNPTESVLFIQSKSNVKSTQLYDISGKLILEGNTKNLDLSTQPKGVYILKTIFENGKTTSNKVIKK